MVTQNKQEEEKRQMALQVRDTRVFAFMDQLEKAEKFPVEIRTGVVSMLNEKIKYMMDWETAEMISNSDLVPKDYIGKPNNVFLAIQTGRSLGLDPFQSVKHLYTVNGRTSVFGDMMLALSQEDDKFIDCIETKGELVKTEKHGMLPSWTECKVLVKDREPVIHRYTIEQAMQNPNFNKTGNKKTWENGKEKWVKVPGVWMINGPRMMQMRPRSFALRDAFPGKLSGIYDEYEIQEIVETKDITSQTTDLGNKNGTEGLKDSLKEDIKTEEPTDVEIQDENGKTIKTDDKPEVKKEDPKVQEKPENIEQIKDDFKEWLKEKIVSKEEYQEFADTGGSGEWDKIVKMHKKFSKKAEKKPLGKFAKKLKEIVDLEAYSDSINSLVTDDSCSLLTPENVGANLRTKDEKLANEIFNLIEDRKDIIDSAAKDEKTDAELDGPH